MDDAQKRVQGALETLLDLGFFDGDHHKMYAIDQTIRVLTGCPKVEITVDRPNGKSYTYIGLGESDEYKELVRINCAGEDGPNTYEWDTGIAP